MTDAPRRTVVTARLRFVVAAAAAVAVIATANACGAPQVSLSVRIPSAQLGETKWIEIAALPGGCLAPAQLAGGIPASGPVVRLGYSIDASPPEIGTLDAGQYGFAAVARRADCGVVATGCSVVDVTRGRQVVIDLSPTKNPDAAKCSFGGVCNGGRCLPPSNNTDPAIGEGCSMQLMGAGPLPNALSGAPFLTAPAIVATNAGFLVGYGEFPAVDGSAACQVGKPCLRANLVPLDSGGGALDPIQKTLDGYCDSPDAPDPAALTMTDTGGLLVFSRPACGGKSGLEQLSLDPTGAVKGRSQFLNANAPTIALASHASVPGANKSQSLVALRSNGLSAIFTSDGGNVTNLVPAFGGASDTALSLARGTTALGIRVQGPGSGGGDAGPPTASAAKVYVVSANPDPKSQGALVDEVPSSRSAIAAAVNRVFLVADSAGTPQELAFYAYDLGKSGTAAEGTFSLATDTPLLGLDAAATKDRLFVVVEQQGEVSIAVIDGAASSTPTFIRRVDFANDARIPATYRDGAVAITATDSRVAVAWVSRKTALGQNDTTGGYAIFACK